MDNKEALKSVIQGFTDKMNAATKGTDAGTEINKAVQEMLDEIKKLYPVPEYKKS